MKPAAQTATALLAVVAVVHALRFLFQVPIIVGNTEFTLSASACAAVLVGALAICFGGSSEHREALAKHRSRWPPTVSRPSALDLAPTRWDGPR